MMKENINMLDCIKVSYEKVHKETKMINKSKGMKFIIAIISSNLKNIYKELFKSMRKIKLNRKVGKGHEQFTKNIRKNALTSLKNINTLMRSNFHLITKGLKCF